MKVLGRQVVPSGEKIYWTGKERKGRDDAWREGGQGSGIGGKW